MDIGVFLLQKRNTIVGAWKMYGLEQVLSVLEFI